jgi:tRNA A-37 threonylcarbamoyl transferase component Bud32
MINELNALRSYERLKSNVFYDSENRSIIKMSPRRNEIIAAHNLQNVEGTVRVNTENAPLYLIMKYAGESLDKIDQNLIPKNIIQQIEMINTNIHKKGFYHGDIHLKNICYNHETDEVTIIDFGLSENKGLSKSIRMLMENVQWAKVKYQLNKMIQ